jgi:hypothetical protein
MLTPIRTLLAVQIFVFAFAAIAHTGIFGSRTDPAAAFAEALIAVALAIGLVVSVRTPADSRAAALASQGFALLGTLIGFTLVVFVGPTHAFDVLMHSTMLALLVGGLWVTWQTERSALTP